MHVPRVVFAFFIAIVSILVATSCQEVAPIDADAASVMSSAAAGADASAPDASSAPRRPTHKFYLVRTQERCEVHSSDGEKVFPAERVSCPQDLEVGERIRLAGKTCMREGRPERARPVVCPGTLLYAYDRIHGRPDAGDGSSKP